MTDIILQHPALNFSEDLSAICRPLHRLNIDYFSHVRVKKNGDLTGLASNPGFSENYLRKKYYNADIHMAREDNLGEFVLWDAIDLDPEAAIMNQEAANFGIQHTFTIIEKNAEWNDYYHFSNSANSKAINQVYLANYDLLKLFIQHFHNNIKQSKPLSHAYDLVFRIEDEPKKIKFNDDHSSIFTLDKRIEFLNCLTVDQLESLNKQLISKIQTTAPGSQIEDQMRVKNEKSSLTIESFSKRELECIRYTLKGKSAKQISYELKISTRTVEEYLANIKTKMGVYSKSELIENALLLFS